MLLFMTGLAENDENFLVPNKNDTTFLVKVKKKKPEGGGTGNKRWVGCNRGTLFGN